MSVMPDPQRPSAAPLLQRLPESARAAYEAGLAEGPPRGGQHAETAEERAERLAQRAQGYAARWVRTTPPMYVAATLDDLDDDQGVAQVRAWLASPSVTLVLAGGTGVGKTHAAYAVGHQAVQRAQWVEAWTASEFLEAVRPNGDPWALSNARACDLLIMDDLGASKATDFAVDTLTSLLDHRIREQRRQVFTTNMTAEVLGQVYGPRFLDRLTFRMTAVTMYGESRRKAAW